MKPLSLCLIILTLFISSCASVEPRKSDDKYWNKASKIVKEQFDQILKPGETTEKAWKDTPKDFSYKYRIVAPTMDIDVVEQLKLTKVVGDLYVFDRFVNGKNKNSQKAYLDGVKYRYYKGEIKKTGMNVCDPRELGDCSYKSRGKDKKLSISYKDGVWTSKWLRHGLASMAIENTVYDKRGIPLFSWLVFENKLQGEYVVFQTVEKVE